MYCQWLSWKKQPKAPLHQDWHLQFSKQSWSHQGLCTVTTKATTKTLANIRMDIETKMESVTLSLCKTLLHPQTEDYVQFLSLHLKKDILN